MSPNAAMTHGEVGAKLYVPACGPEPTLMLAVLPSRSALRQRGRRDEREDSAAETTPAKMRGVFTVT